MEGNASVYQVYSVSPLAGEERAEFLRTWGPGFDQEGPGEGGTGGATQCVRGNCKYLKGITLTVLERMYASYRVVYV